MATTNNSILLTDPSETVKFNNSIVARFFDNLDVAAKDFSENGKLSFPIIEKILGKPPIIPSSPDMDARLEAYGELTQYSTQVLNIEGKLRTYAEKKRA